MGLHRHRRRPRWRLILRRPRRAGGPRWGAARRCSSVPAAAGCHARLRRRRTCGGVAARPLAAHHELTGSPQVTLRTLRTSTEWQLVSVVAGRGLPATVVSGSLHSQGTNNYLRLTRPHRGKASERTVRVPATRQSAPYRQLRVPPRARPLRATQPHSTCADVAQRLYETRPLLPCAHGRHRAATATSHVMCAHPNGHPTATTT